MRNITINVGDVVEVPNGRTYKLGVVVTKRKCGTKTLFDVRLHTGTMVYGILPNMLKLNERKNNELC